jgi:hypothetical protein
MSKFLLTVILIFSLATYGCGGLSSDFKKEGGYLYYLLSARGGQLLQRDFDSAIARAEAAKKSDADSKAMGTLEDYAHAIQYSDGGSFDKRAIEVCQWEAAQRLETTTAFIELQPSLGDCRRMSGMRVDRIVFVTDCAGKDPDLIKLKALEKNADSKQKSRLGDYGSYVKLMQLRSAKEEEITARCKKDADAKFPPI